MWTDKEMEAARKKLREQPEHEPISNQQKINEALARRLKEEALKRHRA